MSDRASKVINSLTEDMTSILENLTKLQQGKLRKVDCFPTIINSIKRDLQAAIDRLPQAIINSKD
jgi:hypothetical protein